MKMNELKISEQTAEELETMLGEHFSFIGETTQEKKAEQAAFYEGMLFATEILFSATRDKQGKHHIKPYPTD